MSDSVWPHRSQPTRFPCPRDSPGKNIGVGCHFLLQCMKVKNESEVTRSCLTLSDPMDCSLPGSTIHGIFQAKVLEWGAIAFFSLQSIGSQKSWTWLKRLSMHTTCLKKNALPKISYNLNYIKPKIIHFIHGKTKFGKGTEFHSNSKMPVNGL